MSFLAPGFLIATALAVLGVVAVHFLGRRRPDEFLLPTARFVPDQSAREASRSVRLSDGWLLLLRATILALAGLALARPVWSPRRSGAAAVIMVDRSRAVADAAEVDDSLRGLAGEHQTRVLIGFDTTATLLPGDSHRRTGSVRDSARGSISSALVAGIREADRLRRRHEHVRLLLVSPVLREELDEATAGIRALWRDSIRVVRVGGATSASTSDRLEVRASGDDPVAAGARLARAHGVARAAGDVRIVRTTVTADDTAWTSAATRLLVHWPGAPDAAGEVVRGVIAGDATVIGYLRPTGLPGQGAVLARWLDGSPAAVETRLGAGCIRHVGFDAPIAGDLTLTPAFQHLMAELLGPCRWLVDPTPAGERDVAQLVAGPTASPRSGEPPTRVPIRGSRIGAFLLLAALALALVELLARRGVAGRPAFSAWERA